MNPGRPTPSPAGPRRCTFAASLLLTLACRSAGAEGLLEVFDLARAHDPSLHAAQAELRAAAPHAQQADAALRPNVSLAGSGVWARYDPPSGALDPDGRHLDTRTETATVTARQSLYNRGIALDARIAHVAQDAAQADYDTHLQDFELKVAQAYFDVLAAQEVLAAARQAKVSIGGQLDAATRNYAAGTAVVTDQQDAQARYDLALSDELAAENDLKVRRGALDRMTGRRGLVLRGLPQPLIAPTDMPGRLDDWQRIAEDHPAIRRARLALGGATLATDRARAAALPTVDAVGSYGITHVSGSGANIASTYPSGSTRNGSIGIEITVPLYAGGAISSRVEEAELRQERSRDELDAQRQAITDLVEHAFLDVESGRAQVNALEAAQKSAASSVEGTQIAYRSGVRLNLDVLNAQTLLFQTERDLAKARCELLMRGLRLRAAAGRLGAEDLAVIDRGLAS
jgi:outer membrane protein